MAVTRADAVIDALVSTLRTATGLTTVTILDGPPVTDDPLHEVITVGFAWDPDDDLSAETRQEYHELGMTAKRDETVDVYCAVRVVNGDADVSGARARAVVLLGAAETALRATPSLGLSDLLRCELSVGALRQTQDGEGAGALIRFTVTATALI